MKKLFAFATIAVLLSACAGTTSNTGNTEMYGQISGGVETRFK